CVVHWARRVATSINRTKVATVSSVFQVPLKRLRCAHSRADRRIWGEASVCALVAVTLSPLTLYPSPSRERGTRLGPAAPSRVPHHDVARRRRIRFSPAEITSDTIK